MPALRVLILGLNYAPESTGIGPLHDRDGARPRPSRAPGAGDHRLSALPQWRIDDRYGGLRTRELDGTIEITRVRHPVPRNPSGLGRIGMEAVFAAHTLAVREPTKARRHGCRCCCPGPLQPRDLRNRRVVRPRQQVGRTCGRRAPQARRRCRRHPRSVPGQLGEHRRRSGTDRRDPKLVARRAGDGRPCGRARGLGWREDELVALHAGNMGTKQGLENLVTAARLAQHRGLPVRFVLLGDGSRRADLESQAAGCDRLSFVDPVGGSEIPEVLAAADALLLNEKPGVKEMCVPSKLTSYFPAGRPVIVATDADSAAAGEMAAAGAGAIVPADDPAAHLDALLDVTADDAAVTATGESATRIRPVWTGIFTWATSTPSGTGATLTSTLSACGACCRQDEPDDYVQVPGTAYRVRDVVELTFEHAGLDRQRYVRFDDRDLRPSEADSLIDDASKAQDRLGCKAQTLVPELVKIIV